MDSIVPQVKLLISYDIRPGEQDTFYQFVVSEFVPTAQEMGLYMVEAWHTAYGDYPLRLNGFVAENLETLQEVLDSDTWKDLEARLLQYVTGYSRKIVRYREGFQF